MSIEKRSRRYLAAAGDVMVKRTRGIPVEAESGIWVVSILCSDGRVRMFRTAGASRPNQRKTATRRRFDVIGRDQFRCAYCGRGSGEVALEVDHLVPLAHGGTDTMDNLITACRECNAGKADAILEIAE